MITTIKRMKKSVLSIFILVHQSCASMLAGFNTPSGKKQFAHSSCASSPASCQCLLFASGYRRAGVDMEKRHTMFFLLLRAPGHENRGRRSCCSLTTSGSSPSNPTSALHFLSLCDSEEARHPFNMTPSGQRVINTRGTLSCQVSRYNHFWETL